ncbi:PREDICTED: zinc finger protein ZAT9-like [Camelina sativa]|uniref:Zinc finger protein ZAT9-like n=1 Tax=Camelina sativa TaxID=90675 RepID=A0ABM0WCM8_CAMSA|nr:PREDICTED: zinc finger protein ZAT9-like [Camelina sativa]
MENYKCRYCFKSFANGRALGGHMRSHMPSLHVDEERPSQLSYETTESDVSSSSSKEKRNGKKNDDPKFASTSSLLLLEDGDGDDESETESSRNVINLTRKRSKRTRKLDSFATKKKKVKTSQLGYKSDPEPPHSSASDTTTEEDLAFCLMMLSRDKWKKNKSSNNSKEVVEEIETEEEEEEELEGYNNRLSKMNRTTRTTTTKGRYKCETCGKVFKSYQALGGHRASHKKNRVSNKTEQQRSETEHDNVVVVVAAAEKRIHECPICFRVFASGQALGGHKRSHGIGNLSVNHHQAHHQIESVKQRMIDLNLPAPTEEDEVSVVFQ